MNTECSANGVAEMLNWSMISQGGGAAASQPVKDGGAPSGGPLVPEKKPKAKVALALGGGAARGWAHIGSCGHSTKKESKSA